LVGLVLLLVAAVAVIIPSRSADEAGAVINQGTRFDPEGLDPQPLWSAGVTNPPSDPNANFAVPARAAVWDFAEIGDRIFVAGLFPTVKESWNGPERAQSYVAAFDRDSGAWISSWRPTLNGGAYALEVTSGGKLLVGGSFTQVNGSAREGLVALDPTSGAIDANFATQVQRWWETENAIVRGLERVGGDIYVLGNFDHVRQADNATRVWSAVRVRAGSGQLDPSFVPKVRYGAWDVAVDQGRGRVHITGDFNEIDGQTNHAKFGTVDLNGNPINNLTPYAPNNNTQTQQPAVAMANDRVYTGGSEHVTQVMSGSNLSRLGWLTWGLGCDTFRRDGCNSSDFGGGDVQVLETIDGWVMAGCHCWNRNGDANRLHYSSFTGQRTPNRFVGIYRGSNSSISSFVPNLRERQYGTWGIHVDSNGCLYLGGDYTGAANGQWVGGFAKFCSPTPAPSVDVAAQGSSASVTWTQPEPTGSLPITGYRVRRNGSTVATLDGNARSWTDPNPPVGQQLTYSVEATDSHDRRASDSDSVTITPPAADTQDPSGPLGPDATTTSDRVTLTWQASADDVGVVGYLIHSNYQYVAYVSGANTTTHTHTGLTAGAKERYQIRAKDAADNVSIPSVRLDVVVGQGVVVPDNLPRNVNLTQNGTSVLVDWDAPPNPGGIRGYLVHDNYQYVAYISGVGTTRYNHTGLAPGTTHRYEIRAQGNGVTSLPTERKLITLN